MNTFDEQMTQHQIEWRKGNITSAERGLRNGTHYDHVLPPGLWEEGLWPGIRSDSRHSLPDYLTHNRVQKHSDANNLKSSWVLCANLYFPFAATDEGLQLIATFLTRQLSIQIDIVDGVELEYEETGDLHPSLLLGEIGGSRGAGQTSPDIAFKVNGGAGLILVENKFLEKSFSSCSARNPKERDGRSTNPDPDRCINALDVVNDPKNQCHQVEWGRKYWDLLAPVVKREKISGLKTCPAAGAGYQLFRQQALAEGIAASGKYALVFSCLAVDARNTTLAECLNSTGVNDIRQWGQLFDGKAHFAVFTHQDWVAWVRDKGANGVWTDWLEYVEKRYGFTA